MRTTTALTCLLLEERDALTALLAAQRALLTALVADPDQDAVPALAAGTAAASNRLRRRLLDRDLEVHALALDRGLAVETDLLGVVRTTGDPTSRAALEDVLDALRRAATDVRTAAGRLAAAGWPCARVEPDTYRCGRYAGPVPADGSDGRP